MQHILRIIKIALRYKYRLSFAYLSTIGAIAAYIFLPKLFGDAIDSVAEPILAGDSEIHTATLYTCILAILGLSVIRGAMSYFQTYLGETLSQYVSYDLRNSFYDHIQHQSFAFHDKHHTGNLMSRAITDVENIRMFINMGLVRAPYFIALFIIVAGTLISMNWKLGLLSASFMPVVAIYTSAIRLRMRALWLLVQEKMAELSIILQENFSGQRVVKAFASENHEADKFEIKNSEVADLFVEAEKLRASSMSFMLFTFMVAMALILWYGGRQVMNGNMTPGELAAFVFYLQILALPVRMAGWVVNAYARAASAGERLFEILDAPSPVQEIENATTLKNLKGHIEFDNVSFAYDDGKPVLRNINLEANPGEIIALVGPPGSGKSTIANLLPRFYDVSTGSIKVDGVDVKEFTLHSLRENIGMVQQDVFLFTTSLKENIKYGREDATDEQVKRASSIAQLSDFIETLDEGYDTYVGERGSTLSGGQRQRMSIARAVLLDPPILILDDSTSSVDADTEDQIKAAMDNSMEGRTTFIIANRLSTVHRADKIVVLKDGRIIEEGTHQELLEEGGLYNEIYELQLRPQDELNSEVSR
ncbi:MAG: ABC transporter ATP-binding protein/permease [Dehalococcoidia bacterium]|nr:ABC transporter ATP-binding protein/permease [Dehalococcoidia bacterium]